MKPPWLTTNVQALARAAAFPKNHVYNGRIYDAALLPFLADALEEAGCTSYHVDLFRYPTLRGETVSKTRLLIDLHAIANGFPTWEDWDAHINQQLENTEKGLKSLL